MLRRTWRLFLGVALLPAAMFLLAAVVATMYLGPDSSVYLRDGLTSEVWVILLAASQVAFWYSGRIGRWQRVRIAVVAMFLGLIVFISITELGQGRPASMNALDLLARYLGIASALAAALWLCRVRLSTHLEKRNTGNEQPHNRTKSGRE